MTDSDDDYCVSYTVTMVVVRGCTRPFRLLQTKSSIYIGKYIFIHTYLLLCIMHNSKQNTLGV